LRHKEESTQQKIIARWRFCFQIVLRHCKGGDYRAREANVHRLAEVSTTLSTSVWPQGVPLAREYGGLLDNRSFGGALVSRTFYAEGKQGNNYYYWELTLQ
jgi:succinate dehydrogenase / fumarate reductase flavoprotein subunit